MRDRSITSPDHQVSESSRRRRGQSKLSPEQRATRASLAAYARWAKEDPTPNARRATDGLRAKFERETREEFPDLPDAEINRRAECAFRAHMQRLALASSKARSRRTSGKGAS